MNKAKKNVIEKGILYCKLVDLKITAPDVVLDICEARNKELDIAIKETIEERHHIHTINLECARVGRTKEILLLLKAFDLDEAIDKIESTWRDELNTSDTEKLKEGENGG